MTLTANRTELKECWLLEINEHTSDPLTLHEHTVDDLRIDPTQIKPDSEYENFKLPIQRKASYESDGIKPSEVAKDHFLSEEERAYYAKQHAENQKILQQQQKAFEQQKTQTVRTTQIKTKSKSQVVQEKLLVKQQQQQAQVQHTKLVTQQGEIKVSNELESSSVQKRSDSEKQVKLICTLAIGKDNSVEDRPQTIQSVENREVAATVKVPVECTKEEIKVTEIIESSKGTQFAQEAGTAAGKLESVVSPQTLVIVDSEDSISQSNFQKELNVDDKEITISAIDTNNTISFSSQPTITMHSGDSINALDVLTKQMPYTAVDNRQEVDANANANPNKSDSVIQNNNNVLSNQTPPHHRLQTISIYNFGDKPGAPGQPPISNLPDFLLPSHLIRYETSIEINFQKIPPPQPAPPPKFIKKMLVHTESLERRTRAFLTENFEVGTTDNALRTARQKIRSLKSTILKSDDEVKHAEDTIHKAQSGDFLNIFAPPIVEPPLYEFIEVTPSSSQRSEDELSENLDHHSERDQSASTHQQQQQELENMEDYYSSKYSSRSSRQRRVEGK